MQFYVYTKGEHMQKIDNVKDFVEKVDASKKLNPKDLSSDQDLTIAIMNLISIEEHLMFSGAKTGKNSFFDMIQDIREMRKNLMLKIIPTYEGEVWCISKHLLAASMRLMEVGTKQQSMNNKEEAYKLFNQAYDLYCLFWGLNMNLIDKKNVKWIGDSDKEIKELSQKIEKNITAIPKTGEIKTEKPTTVFGKMKDFVRNAVNCCIE